MFKSSLCTTTCLQHRTRRYTVRAAGAVIGIEARLSNLWADEQYTRDFTLWQFSQSRAVFIGLVQIIWSMEKSDSQSFSNVCTASIVLPAASIYLHGHLFRSWSQSQSAAFQIPDALLSESKRKFTLFTAVDEWNARTTELNRWCTLRCFRNNAQY